MTQPVPIGESHTLRRFWAASIVRQSLREILQTPRTEGAVTIAGNPRL